MKFTDTVRPPKVRIGSAYVPPPMRVSEDNALLQAALLPRGRRWQRSARDAAVQWIRGLYWIVLLGAGFLAFCFLPHLL